MTGRRMNGGGVHVAPHHAAAAAALRNPAWSFNSVPDTRHIRAVMSSDCAVSRCQYWPMPCPQLTLRATQADMSAPWACAACPGMSTGYCHATHLTANVWLVACTTCIRAPWACAASPDASTGPCSQWASCTAPVVVQPAHAHKASLLHCKKQPSGKQHAAVSAKVASLT